MSISDGDPANQTITNAAFVSRTTDSNTTAKIDLENVDALSGASTFNIQREFNSEASYTGKSLNSAKDDKPTYSSDAATGVTPKEDLTARAGALTAQMKTNENSIAANTLESANIRTTQGTANADTDMGVFSGVTISDNVSVKTALQELETKLELLTGSLIFKGLWDASTNTPALASSTGTEGWFYI